MTCFKINAVVLFSSSFSVLKSFSALSIQHELNIKVYLGSLDLKELSGIFLLSFMFMVFWYEPLIDDGVKKVAHFHAIIKKKKKKNTGPWKVYL